MTFKIQNEFINISCPQCGKQFKAKITRKEGNNEITCPGCGLGFSYQPEQLSTDDNAINEILKEFSAGIGAIAKKK